jgi:hypothetical protein
VWKYTPSNGKERTDCDCHLVGPLSLQANCLRESHVELKHIRQYTRNSTKDSADSGKQACRCGDDQEMAVMRSTALPAGCVGRLQASPIHCKEAELECSRRSDDDSIGSSTLTSRFSGSSCISACMGCTSSAVVVRTM